MYSNLKARYEEQLMKCEQQVGDSLSHKAVQAARSPARAPARPAQEPAPAHHLPNTKCSLRRSSAASKRGSRWASPEGNTALSPLLNGAPLLTSYLPSPFFHSDMCL